MVSRSPKALAEVAERAGILAHNEIVTLSSQHGQDPGDGFRAQTFRAKVTLRWRQDNLTRHVFVV